MDTKKLAKEIANYLFADGSGKHAKRLVMEHEGEHIDGTGWSESAIIDAIEFFLKVKLNANKVAQK